MPARKYTDEQLNEAASLREAGCSFKCIEAQTGVRESAANWHCLRLGADSPNTTGVSARAAGPVEMQRGNHVVRRFSEDEDAKLIRLEAEGLRVCEISKRMGRKPNSIRGRLMTLARHDARREMPVATIL